MAFPAISVTCNNESPWGGMASPAGWSASLGAQTPCRLYFRYGFEDLDSVIERPEESEAMAVEYWEAPHSAPGAGCRLHYLPHKSVGP